MSCMYILNKIFMGFLAVSYFYPEELFIFVDSEEKEVFIIPCVSTLKWLYFWNSRSGPVEGAVFSV